MKININNYEEIIVDFLDGKLDNDTVAELFLFLDQNPKIKAEFNLLYENQHVVEAEPISFDFSSLIKKEKLNVADYAEKLIALLENDLNLEETKKLKAEINAYPELAAEFELFKKTKLVAETNIVFANKAGLTKKKVFEIIPLFTRFSAIAAVFIAIIITVYLLNNKNNKTEFASNIENSIAKSKQDSIMNIIKSKNNIPNKMQFENEKKMLAFGGINPATIQKKKATAPNQIKQNKKIIRENPLNNSNGQSVNPTILPKKATVSDKVILNNNLVIIDKKEEALKVVANNLVDKKEESKVLVSKENSEPSNSNYNIANIASYVKEQLAITSQSEVIAINKPSNKESEVSLGESIGLNVLSLFNKISSKDLKVKKIYNKDGEVEDVKLIASGW
jgi:hypothetical protein